MQESVGWFAPALLAALSYAAKLLVSGLQSRWAENAKRVAKLVELSSLLTASAAVFWVQRGHAQRLVDMVRKRLPDRPYDGNLDRFLAQEFSTLTPEERDLHTIIRAASQHGLHPLNKMVSTWLRQDRIFKVGFRATAEWARLATKLNQLDAHLITWLAKYEAWIPSRPEHALVYVGDEERHGVGFPVGLDLLVRERVSKLRPYVNIEEPPRRA